MNEENKVEQESVPQPDENLETETQAPSEEDPVKAELEAVEKKSKRTALEKLEYSKRRIEEQLAEEKAKSGIVEDDDRPMTVAEYKRLRGVEGIESASEMADNIEDEHERKLTKHYLENSVKPSGDPKADFSLAQAMVNAVKNRQVAEDSGRAMKVRTNSSTPSAPPKEKTQEIELSKEDAAVARGFNLSQEEIAKAVQ